jgi:hypothetical protein
MPVVQSSIANNTVLYRYTLFRPADNNVIRLFSAKINTPFLALHQQSSTLIANSHQQQGFITIICVLKAYTSFVLSNRLRAFATL